MTNLVAYMKAGFTPQCQVRRDIAQKWVEAVYPVCAISFNEEECRFYADKVLPTKYFYENGLLLTREAS